MDCAKENASSGLLYGWGGVQVVELEDAGDELESIQQEIQMLQAFDCPQLTRYHGSFVVGR